MPDLLKGGCTWNICRPVDMPNMHLYVSAQIATSIIIASGWTMTLVTDLKILNFILNFSLKGGCVCTPLPMPVNSLILRLSPSSCSFYTSDFYLMFKHQRRRARGWDYIMMVTSIIYSNTYYQLTSSSLQSFSVLVRNNKKAGNGPGNKAITLHLCCFIF